MLEVIFHTIEDAMRYADYSSFNLSGGIWIHQCLGSESAGQCQAKYKFLSLVVLNEESKQFSELRYGPNFN